MQADLAAIKLKRLADDLMRARLRLNEFAHMLPSPTASDLHSRITAAESSVKSAIEQRRRAA